MESDQQVSDMEEAKRTLQALWDALQIIMKKTKTTTSHNITLICLAIDILDIVDKYPNLSEEVLGFDALKELDELQRRDPCYRHKGW